MNNRSQRSALVIMEATHQLLLKAGTYPLSLRFFLKDEPVSPLSEDWSPRSLFLPLFPFTLLLIQQVYIEAATCQIPCYTLGGRQQRSPICTHSFFASGLHLRPLAVLSEASWYPSGWARAPPNASILQSTTFRLQPGHSIHPLSAARLFFSIPSLPRSADPACSLLSEGTFPSLGVLSGL